MNMFKSVNFQNYLTVVLFSTLAFAGLLAHTMIPILAILGSFVLGMAFTRLVYRKKWNIGTMNKIAPWKKYTVSGLIAAAASQLGWVALLI